MAAEEKMAAVENPKAACKAALGFFGFIDGLNCACFLYS